MANHTEVNPVEHLWEELREKYLHNRVFPSLDELSEVLYQALTELTADKERLHSMMFFPHFRIENENANWYKVSLERNKDPQDGERHLNRRRPSWCFNSPFGK